MSAEKKFDDSLDLLRRLDPKYTSESLNQICTLVQNDGEAGEELALDLLSSVDTPLKIQKCGETGKEYLCCDYNRDGDSYRSPWSNKYFPVIDSLDDELPPPFPSNILRELEIKANDSFEIYKDLYYEGGGISSVYLWDVADDEEESPLESGFAGVVLIKKETDDSTGKWDSIHVFEVTPETPSTSFYKLTSSVILDLQNSKESSLSLSGSLTRQLESSMSLNTSGALNLETAHLVNIGTIIEKSEYNIRNLLQEVYFDKLKDIMLKDLRSLGDSSSKKLGDIKHSEVIRGLQEL